MHKFALCEGHTSCRHGHVLQIAWLNHWQCRPCTGAILYPPSTSERLQGVVVVLVHSSDPHSYSSCDSSCPLKKRNFKWPEGL